MTQTKWTPGPWGIRQSKSIMDNALLITATQDDGKTFGGHIVTQLCDPDKYKTCTNFTPEEQLANAHLIGAAPELYEALQAIIQDYCEDSGLPHLVAKARAAIAKADRRTD
jgi:hypothetical protein